MSEERPKLTPQKDRYLEGYKVEDPWPLSLPNPLPNRKKAPAGYKKNPENHWEWILDPAQAAALEEGFRLLDEGHSLRPTADYLNAEYGLALSRDKLNTIYYEIHGYTDAAKKRKERNKDQNKWRHPDTFKGRKEYERKSKVSTAKRILSLEERKKRQEEEKKKQEENPAEPPDTAPAPQTKVLFRPNPGPQTDYLAASEQEVLYGGQAGGGKTMALIADPLRYFHERTFQGIIVRRTIDELRDVIWETHNLYPAAFPGAKWNEKKSQWSFPSGARMWFTFLERDQDVLRYQGQAFQYIAFDELTQHATPFAWTYLSSRLRSPESSLPLAQRAATNPGGPGHIWVKKMFIDPAPPNTAFPATDIETGDVLVWPEHHERAG